MIKKLVIANWFGTLPDWYDKWRDNIATLEPWGFDFLVPTDYSAYQERIFETLGVHLANLDEFVYKQKPTEFRPAFGVIFEKELRGYDFWGHADLDTVFGRVGEYVTDELLSVHDVFSNDPNSICGPFSLFRNVPPVNELFRQHRDIEDILACNPKTIPHWFDEIGMSELVKKSDLRVKYAFWQPRNPSDLSGIHFEGNKLCDGEEEIMMCHFNRRRPKVWPCL